MTRVQPHLQASFIGAISRLQPCELNVLHSASLECELQKDNTTQSVLHIKRGLALRATAWEYDTADWEEQRRPCS